MADGGSSIPKIFYYNFRGRAETIRLVMAAGGMKFEDVRFEREEAPKHTANSPFGQTPYMELNGKRYGQSVAIAAYIAKETGLHGKTNLEQLEIDQVMLLIEDFIFFLSTFYNEKDQAKQLEALNKLKTVETPKYFGHFERLLKENGTGYVVGDSLTLADIGIYSLITGVGTNPVLKDFISPLEPFPLLKALADKVGANKGIQEYEERRAKLEKV